MNTVMLFMLAVGLSMDAFAVAVTNGMCAENVRLRNVLACGICFGLFQGAMSVIGFAMGNSFESRITAFDHWIALILLSFIGGKMIIDAVKNGNEESSAYRITAGGLLIQGAATSVDALAVGVSFAALSVNIVSAAAFISAVTCVLSCLGVIMGKFFGVRFNRKAQLAGGIILIMLGVKIFFEHIGIF